uniref:Uncharacterized protein n=1 Tax=Triticum urartu TaxID=4572 RepID=A0A8R7PAC8_TRIUA
MAMTVSAGDADAYASISSMAISFIFWCALVPSSQAQPRHGLLTATAHWAGMPPLFTGTSPSAATAAGAAALRAMMTELITSSSGWCTVSTSNPPRRISSGSTTGYRKPRAPCALRTTSAAPGAMCLPRCSTRRAFSSAAMPTSAARNTTSYPASSVVTSATSAVRNAMRAPASASLRTSRLARSLASPEMS